MLPEPPPDQPPPPAKKKVGGARPGSGRKPFVPTREQRWVVQVLHAHGFSHRFIARKIGIDENGKPTAIGERTLRKAFKDDLADAHLQVKAAMVATLVRTGLNGNVSAMKYWLACFGGPEWRIPAGADGELPASQGIGQTTIVIRGGLPPVIHQGRADMVEEDDDGDPPPRKTNGHGMNGSDHTD